MEKVKVCGINDIPNNEGKIVTTANNQIAVFNQNGTFFAIDNACPHEGENLGQGELIGDCVECPYHEWKVNVKTGASIEIPGMFVNTYDTEIINNEVYIHIK